MIVNYQRFTSPTNGNWRRRATDERHIKIIRQLSRRNGLTDRLPECMERILYANNRLSKTSRPQTVNPRKLRIDNTAIIRALNVI